MMVFAVNGKDHTCSKEYLNYSKKLPQSKLKQADGVASAGLF